MQVTTSIRYGPPHLLLRFPFASLLFSFLLFSVSVPRAADAQTVGPEAFFRHSDFSDLKPSPSGKYLAALVPQNGRRAIGIVDLVKLKSEVAAKLQDGDIVWFEWVNDDRLVLSVADLQSGLGEQYGGGLIAIDRDGSHVRELSPTAARTFGKGNFRYRHMEFLQALDDGSDDIMVATRDRSAEVPDVYRVNTRTGVKTLKTFDSPGPVARWILDRSGAVRAAITDEKSLRSRAFYRAAEDAPWQLMGDYALGDAHTLPLAFDGDGTLLVTSNVGRDTVAIYTYDMVKNARGEMLAGHERVDITDGLVYDRLKKKIVGVRYDYDRGATAWFDQDWANLQASVDVALPGHANILQRVGREQRLLIHSYSDVDPGSFYLMDTQQRRIEPLLTERKSIKPEAMSPMQVTSYTARDGLRIPAYLTLPKGRDPKNLPLVVYVHGGPWVKGYSWRWDPEIQYLAAQGYAVLAPEPRGSVGYGAKLFRAGWKQWGLAMQDDLNDGVRWLTREGIADSKRVCIMGGSYGGYAVMMGLARDPDVWRCGINVAGVTDVALFTDISWADYSYSDWIKYAAKEMVGDSSADAERFRKTSPLENADRIKAPVLMAYGGLDQRVPLAHGTRMRAALDRPGMSVEWVMYPEEGHGFLKEANEFDFQRRVQKFLAEQLKPDAAAK